AIGSVSGALLGTWLVSWLEAIDAMGADALLSRMLGLVLLVTAGAQLLRTANLGWKIEGEKQPGLATTALGLGIGLLVGLTSIGAGSLLMAVFTLFYPLSAARAVGTDVVHGAILATVAAVAHGATGQIEIRMLSNLLVGSLPGVLLGSWLCSRLSHPPLRIAIATVLAIAGGRLV